MAVKSTATRAHLADQWEKAARRLHQQPRLQLGLAAMAALIRHDSVFARRAALIDLLADGRPHTGQEIRSAVQGRLGKDCWGRLPGETLARDIAVLRKGGIRIAYSRKPAAPGYYLQHPVLMHSSQRQVETINWQLVAGLSRLTVPEKNERAFAAAEFALAQKRRLLLENNPGWSAGRVDREARRQVFGVSEEFIP